MTATVLDDRAKNLLDRLELVGDDVLHDRVSGRKLVLDKTARAFFRVLCEHGTGPGAVEAIVARFRIDRARAVGQDISHAELAELVTCEPLFGSGNL